ncbi:hypothetical protein PACTADRAFT_48400 [Pachysolen tannophilus NRRL Y-2460]|uniref:RNA exonuclease 3 n=1 Tax=Pachysolen tannophilus NRRL Y-2460 TaxID=669874 RepID=A0A1E4TXU8_PACTA|nr:hypothetical protein PACTADRAFT_48400 [Pachysolen tannophilus NRRL Y-2460]
MFNSQTGLFSKITCPSIIRNEQCETLNCLFNHSNVEEKGKFFVEKKKLLNIQNSRNDKKQKVHEKNEGKESVVGKACHEPLIGYNSRKDAIRQACPVISTAIDATNETPPSKKQKITGLQLLKSLEEGNKLVQGGDDSDDTGIEVGISNGNGSSELLPAPSLNKQSQLSESKNHNHNHNLQFLKLNSHSNEIQVSSDIPLIPRPVLPNAPVTTQVRLKYLKYLKLQYEKIHTVFPNKKSVEKEYEFASTLSSTVYTSKVKRLVYNLQKYGKEDPNEIGENQNPQIEEYNLENLLISKEKLAKNGFIVDVPIIPNNYKTYTHKKCQRCGEIFEVDKILKRVKCAYHPNRYYISKLNSHSYASNDFNSKFFPCCNQPITEAQGCKQALHHVFKLDDPIELQATIPFVSTKTFPSKKNSPYKAIALDCEMGFTSLGFELIRITMIDFQTEKVLYDKTIQPRGRICDLNTEFSGVSVINESESPKFNQFLNEIKEFINSDTILIGHGLENDLNVMRLCHDKIIDTSLMFMNGLKRKSLKDLSFEYLSKKIQTGEHDSYEDTQSCIELIKWKLKNKNNPNRR